MDWTKKVGREQIGRKQVGRKLGARYNKYMVREEEGGGKVMRKFKWQQFFQ